MNTKKNMTKKKTAAQKNKGSFIKKWWDTYTRRLNKITDGKPQCCK